ncbi:hypothetical protein DdX_12281 [Ditylenchus destructor]|uniref:Uncharacterized protein n=1 Tax=Ditylenchus destructor TaxID=166010 RepID=A0AAD4R3M3_9BILA|nr:hypothetical protein DdX_12281 [Ditylenchus destructor]
MPERVYHPCTILDRTESIGSVCHRICHFLSVFVDWFCFGIQQRCALCRVYTLVLFRSVHRDMSTWDRIVPATLPPALFKASTCQSSPPPPPEPTMDPVQIQSH